MAALTELLTELRFVSQKSIIYYEKLILLVMKSKDTQIFGGLQ
jgi:hypothetical protein